MHQAILDTLDQGIDGLGLITGGLVLRFQLEFSGHKNYLSMFTRLVFTGNSSIVYFACFSLQIFDGNPRVQASFQAC